MSDVGFEGKVAIITGAGGGLGREHALLLASRGAQVVVNDLGGAVDGTGSSAGPAQKVVEEIEAAGGVAVADANSVATQEGAEAMVKTALDAFGRVDIVINNAGILRDKSFKNMTPDLWDAVIAVHLTGAFNVTRAAWPHFCGQAYGRVVSTSSAAGIFGNFGQANYGAAKMGIVGLTRVWAQEGAKYNIRANAIAPVAKTRMTEDLLGALVEKIAPELVSPVVAYLASEECEVTGEIYSVGGGRVSRIFIAEAPGYFKKDLTIEDVRDNWDAIRAEENYVIPTGVNDEFGKLLIPFLSDEQ
ncbi:MAG TPA: SDR family oxidoreductase [Acidimicrobiia bacterium]|nr:SDR family oxidoreductase [Acidimicrobiia bacterium]